MKKILLAIMLLITPIAISGCEDETTHQEIANNEFIKISNRNDIIIYVHKETKVMYMFVTEAYKGGLTVMVDANGKPLLYQGE